MFIQNISEAIQRTSVRGSKKDVKPWEIVKCADLEALTVTKNYWQLFQIVEWPKKINNE